MNDCGIAAVFDHRGDLAIERSNDRGLLRMVIAYHQREVKQAELPRHEPIGIAHILELPGEMKLHCAFVLQRQVDSPRGKHPGSLNEVGSVPLVRSEEHTSELQSLMRISYAVFCLKKIKQHK